MGKSEVEPIQCGFKKETEYVSEIKKYTDHVLLLAGSDEPALFLFISYEYQANAYCHENVGETATHLERGTPVALKSVDLIQNL